MGLRILLEYRRLEKSRRHCPSLAELTGAGLNDLAERPGFGGKLVAQQKGKVIELLAPPWVDYKSDPPVRVPLFELSCR